MAVNSRYRGSVETRIRTFSYSIMYNKLTSLLLILIFILSCNPDKQTKVDPNEITFATDDASVLFFKNVRQLYYEMEEMEAAKLKIFRHKKRDQSQDEPIINLAIDENWRFDEAYLLLEPNAVISSLNEFTIKWEGETGTGEILYRQGNKSDQVAFADQIYGCIQQGCTFSIQVNDIWDTFLGSEKSREAFRVTMFDYYRLVKRI